MTQPSHDPLSPRRRRTMIALVGALLAALATGPSADAASASKFAGYLFTYFTGESSATGILPAYDSGDHLHPGDRGYQAMADAVNLAALRY